MRARLRKHAHITEADEKAARDVTDNEPDGPAAGTPRRVPRPRCGPALRTHVPRLVRGRACIRNRSGQPHRTGLAGYGADHGGPSAQPGLAAAVAGTESTKVLLGMVSRNALKGVKDTLVSQANAARQLRAKVPSASAKAELLEFARRWGS